MKIMFVSYQLANGGAERVMTIIANNLVKLGHEVSVVVFFQTSNEYFLDSNIRKVYLFRNRKKNIFTSVIALKKIMTKCNPDVVISFLADIECYFANKKSFCITTVRNNPTSKSNTIKHKIRDYVYYHSNLILVQNNEQLQYFSRKIHNKIRIMFNPVSSKFLIINKDYSKKICRIVTAGRLVLQKNQKLLIDSVLELRQRGFEVFLDIYGVGPLEYDLSTYIKAKNGSDFIFLKGRNDALDEALPNYDLFVLPSNEEGSPNALLEAMAIGLPCVSTKCPTGPSSIITDYFNGVLCKVNDLADMTEKIVFLIENNDVAIKIGKNAKSYIKQNYSESIITTRINEILNELVKK